MLPRSPVRPVTVASRVDRPPLTAAQIRNNAWELPGHDIPTYTSQRLAISNKIRLQNDIESCGMWNISKRFWDGFKNMSDEGCLMDFPTCRSWVVTSTVNQNSTLSWVDSSGSAWCMFYCKTHIWPDFLVPPKSNSSEINTSMVPSNSSWLLKKIWPTCRTDCIRQVGTATPQKHQSLNDFHTCVDHKSGLVTTIEALKQSARISLSLLQDPGVWVSCRVTAWKNQRQWHHSIASYCGECASIDTCGPVGLSLKLRLSPANNNNDSNI